MCDLNEEKLEALEELENSRRKAINGRCMKCLESKAVLVVRGCDPLCRSCFLSYATHKFRSTLGKARLIQPLDKVLLAMSGGHSSFCMLHLVREALSERAHKRLKFSPGVLFVDESSLLAKPEEANTVGIMRITEEFEYPFFSVPIYQNFASAGESSCSESESNGFDRESFFRSWNSIGTLTAKEDFLQSLRASVIVHTARKLGYSKVMVGENATTLSIMLFSHIAQGRGATIPLDIGVADYRYKGITFIRPMREFTSKEVAFYNRLNGFQVEPVPNLLTKTSDGASLRRQTEAFIHGLQSSFPSTVNTVFRTGDKLSLGVACSNGDATCALCQAPIVNDVDLELASNISSCSISTSECCEDHGACAKNSVFQPTVTDVLRCLCYGCRLTFKDMNYTTRSLPDQVRSTIWSRTRRERQKSQIQDFLID